MAKIAKINSAKIPALKVWDNLNYGGKWGCSFQSWKKLTCFFDQSNNSGAYDIKMDGSVLEKKIIF